MGIKNMQVKGGETRERERNKEGKNKQHLTISILQLFFCMNRFLENLKL